MSLVVARKEIRDHWRDHRSLLSTATYALIGPAALLLVAVSPHASGERGAFMMSSMASVFALVSAFVGGMNVALDAVAGERERRSLSALLLTSAGRIDLVVGKWIAASIFGLGSMLVTVAGCVAVIVTAGMPLADWTIVPRVALWVLAGLVPLGLFGSACQILVAAKSRNTKEAHTWLSSLVLVPMLAGLALVFAPHIGGPWWPVVPVIGQQVWIGRSLGGQEISVLQLAGVVTTTLAAAALPVWLSRQELDRSLI